MADYGQFAYGNVQFPLTTSTTNSLLQDLDPANYYLLDYYRTVIVTHLGARFAAELTRAPSITSIPSLLAQYVPLDPAPWLQEQQFKFPLLCVYRTKGTEDDRTIVWPHDTCEFAVQYILPPVTGGQAERLIPILNGITKVIDNRTESMMDPTYQSGLRVWAAAGIESIKVKESAYARYDAVNGQAFPCVMLKLLVKERVMPPAAGAFQTFGGIDAAVDEYSSPNAPPVLDQVDSKVDIVDPTTITGLAALYRADAGVQLAADNVHVTAIADQSGNGFTAQPGAASNQPVLVNGALVYNPTTLATRPLLRFDGAWSYLSSTITPLATDGGKTFVVLYRLSDTVKRSSILLHSVANDTGTNTTAIEANTVSTAGGKMGWFANGSSYDTAIPTDTGLHIAVVRETSTVAAGSITANTTYQVDNSAPLTLTNRSGPGTFNGMAASNLLIVGGLPASLSATAAACDVGVWMVFNARLSDSDVQKAILFCRQWAGLP